MTLPVQVKAWIAVRVLATRSDNLIIRVNDAYTNLSTITPDQLETQKQKDLLAEINSKVTEYRKLAADPQKAKLSNQYEEIARHMCDLYFEIINQGMNHHP